MAPKRARSIGPRLVVGLVIVAVGVIFTLDNLGADVDHLFRYWPVVLVVVGLGKLLASEWLGALGWVLAGGILLLPVLFEERVSYADLWPAILILFGLRLVARSMPRPDEGGEGGDARTVKTLAFMSATKRTNASQRFEGGELTAIMGGCELDLTRARLAEPEAVIDAFAFWGGVEIRVPESWSVDVQVLPLMGGAEDNTRDPSSDHGPRLKVRGVALMGGVEVRN